MKIFLLIIPFLLSSTLLAKGTYLRQKINFYGELNSDAPKKVRVDYFDRVEPKVYEVYDPYQGNKLFKFTGISICRLFDLWSKKSKELTVVALNEYQRSFKKESCKNDKVVLAYKQNGDFIEVENYGPARLILLDRGKIKSKDLAREGIDWVWMVRDIKFK